MKIKKFNCIQCGAPKINPYKSPYIVCDFCGSLTDIDYELGLDAWNKNPKRTNTYSTEKIKYESRLAELLGKGDKESYQAVQYEYWDMYYKIYPEYLPPSIHTDYTYKLYLSICAKSSTEYAFDKDWSKKAGEQSLLQQSITYSTENGKTYADSEPFFKLSDFFLNYCKESMIDFYANPDYAIMQDVLPQEVHLKLKMSLFVQAWIPYLRVNDAEKLLQMAAFTHEYIDAITITGNEQICQFCQNNIFIPDGAYKTLCEHCLKINVVRTIFHCLSCGAENTVPENPAKPVDCIHCGTENRLIIGWI